MIYIGTAGWSVSRAVATSFVGAGTHLERYARVLNSAEINSSFYRPHAVKVYERWAASTPAAFRFSVKMPRAITHESRLNGVKQLLRKFLSEAAGLGEKLGAVLVQLPPSLAYETDVARSFFTTLRELYAGTVVFEPRHASWFDTSVESMLARLRIARVAADPAPVPNAKNPGGWSAVPATAREPRPVIYFRLHGSPRMYWSVYSAAQIDAWAKFAAAADMTHDVWFIFDNTAAGGAVENALQLQGRPSSAAGQSEM